MLTPLDTSLYPCDIVLANINSCWVFPIFKNGSSTLKRFCQRNNHAVIPVTKATISDSDTICVFIRKPEERYESGLRTVVYNLARDNPNLKLDPATASFMLQKYLFLDIHFTPQFHWLLNLSRFIGKNVKLKLLSMESMIDIVGNESEKVKKNNTIDIDVNNFQNLYLQLDTIIYNQIGNTLTFGEIIELIKNDSAAKFNELLEIPNSLISLLK